MLVLIDSFLFQQNVKIHYFQDLPETNIAFGYQLQVMSVDLLTHHGYEFQEFS